MKEELNDSQKIDYIYKQLKRQMFFYYFNLILKLIIIWTLFFYWYKLISSISLDSIIKNKIWNQFDLKEWLDLNDLGDLNNFNNFNSSGSLISPELMQEVNNILY